MWYKFTFAIYRKHDSKSLYCYLRLREWKYQANPKTSYFVLLNLPLSISSLIFAISPWAARKCRDGSEKENEELKNVQEVHVYIPSVLCYNSLVTLWSVVNVRGGFYCNIALLWPWNSKIGKINIWASLKVWSCLACGSWLTQAYVWLVKMTKLF